MSPKIKSVLIKKVFELKYTKQKLVGIPKDSKIKAGDYVRITKVEDEDG